MSIWGKAFAGMYDRLMAKSEEKGLGAHRRKLLASASGDVLEIGGGTGANLAAYGPGVHSLTVTEPEEPMMRRLQKRMGEQRPDAKVLAAPAESLPFANDSFDTAVSTLVLCTVGDQPVALRELRRVLRPGGKLLFMEHVRSDDAKVARLQDRMLRFNRKFACGCHCNRATLDGIKAAGFEVTELQNDSIPGAPPWVRPLIVGVAQPGA